MISFLKDNPGEIDLIQLEDKWFDIGEFSDHSLTLDLTPVARLLLTADGSMTQMLEAILLRSISMKVARQEVCRLNDDAKALLGLSGDREGLVREAWLMDGDTPLLYAKSLLCLSGEGTYTLDSLRGVEKPLGRMVKDDNLKIIRDSCRMGPVKSAGFAERYGLNSGTEFWGRYYRLLTDTNLGGFIFELFSPRLFEN